ncbi:Fe3+-siderophore ABC transporter permease [Mannheimia granulomatis]|uniref:Fe3+-siderophore ABC transporter permease n=1 Tax=Mannheimia granulomatis TaxID=85402 RepID=A0A6G8JFT9_9PAST|nr:iron ABC transporter permease [Mannheimia granulomatis]QIM65936.1 Fe3+-siderophore ABC transporter permease [Mannheimia granulomatis]
MKLPLILIFTLIIGVVVCTHLGAMPLPLSAWHCTSVDCESSAYILWQIRLPRLLGSLFIGAALAISGATMQGLFRNPLVDPGIIGVSSGAALAAALYIVIIQPLLPESFNAYALLIAAFLGGWLVTFVLYLLSQRNGQLHIAIMLLIGIALAAFTGALTGVLIYIADDTQLRSLTFWGMGSLAGMNWQMVTTIAIVVIICGPLIWREHRVLNALTLGEEDAQYIGFDIAKVKRRLVFYVALLTGVSVACVGTIGFIGLVIPHLMRLMGGSNHRYLLPNSLILGAILLMLADTLARTLAAPAEIPIGIFTALFGAPFLAVMVWRSGKHLS